MHDGTETNADRFLTEFSRIEQWMHDQVGHQSNNFTVNVDSLSRTLPRVRSYEQKLKQFARLRNAIQRGSRLGGQVIADPRADVVEDIALISRALRNPPTVRSAMAGNIRVFAGEESVLLALQFMADRDFSQVVIRRDDGRHDFLTSNDIAMWLGQEAVKDQGELMIELKSVPANEVPTAGKPLVIASSADAYKAHYMLLKQQIHSVPNLAILVTHNGKSKETPEGVVTAWDLISTLDLDINGK